MEDLVKQMKEEFGKMNASLEEKLAPPGLGEVMTELKSMRDEFTNKSNKLQQLALLNKYEADRLEQYSRRESIRVSGIPDSVNDDTNSLSHFVIQVGKVLKVEIARGDISAIHRV